MTLEFYLFLPQMRMPFDVLVARALAAEQAGFVGVALMDHLAPPGAEDQPMYEAMVAAAWLAARTERLRIGHLVLCDSLRHPAVLASQVVALDHASGGRFDLGLGWGSVPDELSRFGIGSIAASDRVGRLAETIDVLHALWSGETVEFHGEHHSISGAQQRPTPIGPIPLVIGGAGRRTMDLVARHADWWNLPSPQIGRLAELRPHAGDARVSIQQLVTFIPDDVRREATVVAADRRFGALGPGRVTGDAPTLVEHFRSRHAQGVERFYTWFTDFAAEETLASFGRDVIARFA